MLGALLLVGAVAALTVGIVEGPTWGWSSTRVVAAFVATLTLFVAVARRSLNHQSPVIEPAMVRIRGFSIAVAASLIFFVGFAAMLLSGVLFTTGVWGEDVLTAGLMLAPGPAMAATFSIPSARLANRLGYRATGLLGSLLFALAAVWWLTHVSATPDYAGDYLPGMLVSGIGVGLLLPTLTGAGAASLPRGPVLHRHRRSDHGAPDRLGARRRRARRAAGIRAADRRGLPRRVVADDRRSRGHRRDAVDARRARARTAVRRPRAAVEVAR